VVAHGVHGSVRVTVVVVNHLEHTSASEGGIPAERLGVRMLAAELSELQRVADDVLNVVWKFLEVT